jgi:hypothetical protein
MADIRAILSNSDFNLPATWFGNVVPGPNDVAYANGNTVPISDTRTVQALSNASGTSITVGGSFSILNGCNLTATNSNGIVQGATSTPCVITSSLAVGHSATITANISATTANGSTYTFTGGGTLNWVGSISGTLGPMPIISGNGTYNHTGNMSGPTSGGQLGFQVTGAAVVNWTGNISAGPGSSNNYGMNITNAGAQVAVTGQVTGGGQSGAPAAGIVNNAGATLTVNGICQSSPFGPAIGAGSALQITRLSGPFLIGATNNINPVQALSWRWSPTLIPTFIEVARSDGSTKRSMYTADNMPTGGYPVASNVVSPIVYGPNNEFTGTYISPSPSSVAVGVPVGNTVGIAVLTAASVRTAIGMATNNLDTQLANKATVDQVAAIVQDATSA